MSDHLDEIIEKATGKSLRYHGETDRERPPILRAVAEAAYEKGVRNATTHEVWQAARREFARELEEWIEAERCGNAFFIEDLYGRLREQAGER